MIAFVLLCLACACHARRVQISNEQVRGSTDDETIGISDAAEALATVLLAQSPSVAGGHGMTINKHIDSRVGQSARTLQVRMAYDEFDSVKPGTVFMFPGQGAQAIGMGVEVAKEVPAAAQLYAKAKDILGYDLLEIDDKAKLDTTAVSQPAIFVASMAAVEKLRASEGGEDIINSANVAAGLSLGEYTALAFAGAISFEDGVRITKARGEAMQAAADASSSGMVSVIGLDKEKTAEVCAAAAEATGKPIAIANFLCNGNYACSGAMEAVDKVVEIAKPDFKARMAVKLAVAGAFHTDFMAPAVATLGEVLESVEVTKPRIPVISNVDAKAHSDPAVIKEILTKQVTGPVQWETTMNNLLAGGMEKAYELGPGKVLSGIMKRINKKFVVENIEA